jgi:hypothetical protein
LKRLKGRAVFSGTFLKGFCDSRNIRIVRQIEGAKLKCAVFGLYVEHRGGGVALTQQKCVVEGDFALSCREQISDPPDF